MKRLGVVLLLLTSAAAVQYHWQAAVSLPGPAVHTISAVSRVNCALRCERLPAEQCSDFTYGAGDGTCRLFSGDCRGPAADSSQLTTDRYMGRCNCPGAVSDPCGCPAGFSRCAGRCLAWLDQKVNYTEAERLCAELGAHLAVPRSQTENQCAKTAAGDTSVWLGITDVVTEGRYVTADGCGMVSSDDPAWAPRQPRQGENQEHVMLVPTENEQREPGWYDIAGARSRYPLCQLPLCYQSRCQ